MISTNGRASSLVMRNDLHLSNLGCCYVAAMAKHLVNDNEEALLIIEDVEEELVKNARNDANDDLKKRAMISNLYLLKGQILEARDIRESAAVSYSEALKVDLTCVAALSSLTQHQMLTQEEESKLIQTVLAASQPSQESELTQMISHLYRGCSKKYSDIKVLGTPLAR